MQSTKAITKQEMQALYKPISILIHKSKLPFIIVKPIRHIFRVVYANIAAIEYFGYNNLNDIYHTPLFDLIDQTKWLNDSKHSLEGNQRLVNTFIRDPSTKKVIEIIPAKSFSSHTIIEGTEYFSLIFIPPLLGAGFDNLTKLQTMQEFYKDLAELVNKEKKRNKGLFIMFVDLDNFKKVNDTLGHRKGDKVLIEIVDIIRNCLRTNDRLYRYGGDEFSLIFTNITMDEVIGIAERILREFDRKRKVILPKKRGINKKIGLSIGIAYYSHGLNPAIMVERADLAMYAAKNNGGMRIGIYINESNKIKIKEVGVKATKGIIHKIRKIFS